MGILTGTALGRLQKHVPLVYARGGLSLNEAQPAVAIVGARAATPAGLDAAAAIARQMVKAGYAIVSGGARGIDRAAHRAALEAGGKTVVVLAHKNDEDGSWLRDHFAAAFDRVVAVSAVGPAVKHSKNLYAARNKHIAALADEVVVVEGAVGSGTVYTAQAAVKLGVRVWGVGGTTPMSYVPCKLVEEGEAQLLRPWQAARQITGVSQRRLPLIVASPAKAADGPPLVQAIRAAGGRLTVDDAVLVLGVAARDVLADAGALELDGVLRREGPFLVA